MSRRYELEFWQVRSGICPLGVVRRADRGYDGLGLMSGVTDTRPSCSQDMDALGVRRPSAVVRVTEHMDVIRAYISGILEKGMAYQARDGVYFDVARFTQRWCTSRGQS